MLLAAASKEIRTIVNAIVARYPWLQNRAAQCHSLCHKHAGSQNTGHNFSSSVN